MADRAGQSLRTFYQHFESKDDVILAVYEEFFDERVTHAKAHVEEHDDPLDRLAALLIGASDLPNLEPTPLEVALSHFRYQLLQTNRPGGVGSRRAGVSSDPRIGHGHASILLEKSRTSFS